jgi:hypothetical protein
VRGLAKVLTARRWTGGATGDAGARKLASKRLAGGIFGYKASKRAVSAQEFGHAR